MSNENEIETSREFFLVLCAGPDEECSVNWDGNRGFKTESEAIQVTKEDVDCSSGSYMVYRCVPIKRVYGQTKITPFKAKSHS